MNRETQNIAATFYRAGFINAWWRGISKICEGFATAGLAVPVFESVGGGVRVTAMRPKALVYSVLTPARQDNAGSHNVSQTETYNGNGEAVPQSWPQSWPQTTENKVLSLLFFGDMSRKQLSDKLGIVLKANSLREVICRLMHLGFIQYTLPEKPNSRLQKYHLTDEGLKHILRQNAEVSR